MPIITLRGHTQHTQKHVHTTLSGRHGNRIKAFEVRPDVFYAGTRYINYDNQILIDFIPKDEKLNHHTRLRKS